jgi:predicted Zn finger-like uncharacterized protein
MNVRCSQCNTVFRVDPLKVPPQGVRARCSVCRGVFAVEAPGVESESLAAVGVGSVTGPEPSVLVADRSVAVAEDDYVEDSAVEEIPLIEDVPQVPEPEEPLPGLAAATSVPAPAPGESATPSRRSAPRFGGQDPHSKARRLARALVSDMVTYHPDRQERGLRDGSLRKEFKEEIRKSWEEYVEQVGQETAHGTPFFRDALNEILARGQKLF